MSNTEKLKSKLHSKIAGTRFSRLPKNVKEVRIENARNIMEQTIAKMKESVNLEQ